MHNNKFTIVCVAAIIFSMAINTLVSIDTMNKNADKKVEVVIPESKYDPEPNKTDEASVASEPSVSEAEEEPQPIVQNITNNYNITDSYNNNYNITENNNETKNTENNNTPEKKEEVVVNNAPSNNNSNNNTVKQSESIEQPVKKETKNTENNNTVKMYHTPLGNEKNDCDPSPNRVLIKGIKCPQCGANTYTEDYNKLDTNLQHYIGMCSTCYYED